VKIKILNSVLFNCFLLLISCQPEQPIPDQDRIFVSYGLNYSVSQNKTTAEAFFTEENATGEFIELKSPASITFNGDNLLYSTSTETYQKEFIGLKQGDFVYTNLNGTIQTNSGQMVSAINLLGVPDSQSISSDLLIQFDTNPLDIDESYEIRLRKKYTNAEVTIVSDSYPGSTAKIATSYLNQIGPGTLIFSLSRVKKSSTLLESNTVGGEFLIKYTVQDTVLLY
jgi:hypothetical protein